MVYLFTSILHGSWELSIARLRREFQLLSFHLRLCVVVEEVAVQARLDDAENPCCPRSVPRFGDESDDPIEDVERPISAECDDVVGGDVLHRAVALQQNDLRDDRDGLEDDAVGPQDLRKQGICKIMSK